MHLINPSQPTQTELQERGIKIGKINFCIGLASALATNAELLKNRISGKDVARFCIECADELFEEYAIRILPEPEVPDSKGLIN